jgi:hypothetical protein
MLCNQLVVQGARSESLRLNAVVNRWLAIKRQGRWQEIRQEVEGFDTKACNPRYAIAVHSLCDRTDAFFSTLPAAVSGGVTLDEIEFWPALEEMRVAPEFHAKVTALFPNALEDLAAVPVYTQP